MNDLKVGDFIIFETVIGHCKGQVLRKRPKSVIVSGSYEQTVTFDKVLMVGTVEEVKSKFVELKSLTNAKRVSLQQVEENYRKALGALFAKGKEFL